MLVIKVWCLPELTQKRLNQIYRAIVLAVEGVPGLGVKGQHSMTILFPPDAMDYGLGEEIIIEATGVPIRKGKSREVRNGLSEALGTTVMKFFPQANIECTAQAANPRHGFWRSGARMGRRHKPTQKELTKLWTGK